jgi:glycosyltransferase involved in cell wall biosynthesis
MHYFVFTFSALLNAFKIKSYDLIIISSPPLFVGLIGVMLKKWKSIDFWLDVRDIWPESAIALKQINNNWLYFFGKKMEQIIYNSAKGFIFAVPGFKKYFCNEFQSESKKPMLNLINGVSNDFLEKAKITDFKKPKRFTVLYSGNIGLAQGLETVIESAKLLIEYPIDFMFVGNGVCREDLEELVKINEQKNVHFYDTVSRHKLIKFIKQSSVCLVHLKNKQLFNVALPSKTFEYMACERPVIVGVKGEIENIINSSKSGIIVEPENPTKLSQTILNYYNNPDKSIKDGMSGLTYITDNLVKEELISILMNKIQ